MQQVENKIVKSGTPQNLNVEGQNQDPYNPEGGQLRGIINV